MDMLKIASERSILTMITFWSEKNDTLYRLKAITSE